MPRTDKTAAARALREAAQALQNAAARFADDDRHEPEHDEVAVEVLDDGPTDEDVHGYTLRVSLADAWLGLRVAHDSLASLLEFLEHHGCDCQEEGCDACAAGEVAAAWLRILDVAADGVSDSIWMPRRDEEALLARAREAVGALAREQAREWLDDRRGRRQPAQGRQATPGAPGQQSLSRQR